MNDKTIKIIVITFKKQFILFKVNNVSILILITDVDIQMRKMLQIYH